jgi:hypothetical protein
LNALIISKQVKKALPSTIERNRKLERKKKRRLPCIKDLAMVRGKGNSSSSPTLADGSMEEAFTLRRQKME